MNWKQETKALIDIIEIYYKKGGYSELPNEVVNDIEGALKEQTEEIERLKKANKKLSRISNKKEIENFVLKNIINELEKYANSLWLDDKGIVLRFRDKLQELKGEDK